MSQSNWWADSGPDSCEFCEVSYYGETGYHCAMCDRPMCSSCIVTVFDGRRVLCPECEYECNSEGDSKCAPDGEKAACDSPDAEPNDLERIGKESNERKDENNGEQN